MTNSLIKWPSSFKKIDVLSSGAFIGLLSHESQYTFTYAPQITTPGNDIQPTETVPCSLTMKKRAESYTRNNLHPVFEMNLPEGFLRRYIADRLIRHTKINDMLFLALQGDRGIGHLSYQCEIDFGSASPMSFDDLLSTPKDEGLFDYLLDRYGLTHSLSGMQPKLLVNTDRSTLNYPNCIVKTGDDEFPDLAINEYVCMQLAKAAGIEVPDHYLSDDRSLFVIDRFDLSESCKLAFEDFCSLMGKQGADRYNSSYESAAKVFQLYNVPAKDLEKYFSLVVFNACIGNGDAHLKNFGLLYTPSDENPVPRLSPAYDLTCTLYYEHLNHTMALKINKENKFPNTTELMRFGKSIGIRSSRRIIEQIIDGVQKRLFEIPILSDYPRLRETIANQTRYTSSEAATGLRSNPGKKRKY